MKALLIIDMQKGYFPSYSTSDSAMALITRINTLSDKFREMRFPVIFIQNDGTIEGDDVIPHTDKWSLLPELKKFPTDLYIDKTANDSFYNSTLQQNLSRLSAGEIFITGSATDFCVDATVKSALTKDYKVTVVADCHTTEDKEKIPAAVLIEHYNWVWSVMAPAKHKISVLRAGAIEF